MDCNRQAKAELLSILWRLPNLLVILYYNYKKKQGLGIKRKLNYKFGSFTR